jgi:hypothetical protein
MPNRDAALEGVRRRVHRQFESRALTRRFFDALAEPTVRDGRAMLEPFLPALRWKLARWSRKALP